MTSSNIFDVLRNFASKIRQKLIGKTLTAGSRPSDMSSIFGRIYDTNYWANKDSRSGAGSDLAQTEVVRRELPLLIKEFNIKTMLDAPCGDWHWMQAVDLDVDYIGADLVPAMIERNKENYEKPGQKFMVLDIAESDLPKVDMMFSRDVLVHFSLSHVAKTLENIKKSGTTYLLTTTFVERSENIEIETGQWRPLNLQKMPFFFPEPIKLINENCTEGDGSWGDKCLGLWEVEKIPAVTIPND